MNEYTHDEIVTFTNNLIDDIDLDEYDSKYDLYQYLDETFKNFDMDVPDDIINEIIEFKCKNKLIVDEVDAEDLYESILDKKMHYIKNVPQPEQRTKAWFDMRNNMITASSGATALSENPYEKVDGFVMEKVFGREFMDNEFVHHGKKYEEIATKLYGHIKNVKVDEYGLIQHPKYTFFGASPDGICDKYTLDGEKNLKNYGRMLEIKCPYKRKILMEGKIDDEICPHYYWIQIQLQLECCDLEYCDFWQCEIKEYYRMDEWMKPVEMNHRYEQNLKTEYNDEWTYGFVLQYKMDNYVKRNATDKEVFCSKYLYPDNLNGDYQAKVVLSNKMKEQTIPGYTFDRILYWRIVNTHCCEVRRDRVWFKSKFPIFKDVWNRIEYLRKDPEVANMFRDKILAKKEENKARYARRFETNEVKTADELAELNESLTSPSSATTPSIKKSNSASWF